MVDRIQACNLPLMDDVSSKTSLNGSAKRSGGYEAVPASPTTDIGIRSYRRRWPVLVLLIGNVILLNLNWVFFSPISDVVMCYYRTTTFWANAISMCYMLTYIILVGPVAWMLQTVGLRVSMVTATACIAIGAWIKFAGTDPHYFWLIIIGQLVASIANTIEWSAPSLFSSVWFPAHQRATVTAILGSACVQAGALLSYVLGTQIVHSDDTSEVCGPNTSVTSDQYASWSNDIYYRLFYYQLGHSIFATLMFIVTLCAFPGAPPTAPSASKELMNRMKEKLSVLQWLKLIFSHIHFPIFIAIFSINITVNSAIIVLLNEIVLFTFPGHQVDVGYMGAVVLIAGMVCVFIVGKCLDWTKRYYFSSVTISVLGAVSIALFSAAVQFQRHISVIYVAVALIGATLSPFQGVAYEYAIEMTYPLPEGTSAGIMNMASQVLSIAVIVGMGVLISNRWVFAANWMMTGFTVLSAVLAAFVKPNLKREKLDTVKPDV